MYAIKVSFFVYLITMDNWRDLIPDSERENDYERILPSVRNGSSETGQWFDETADRSAGGRTSERIWNE
ncbi:hypothetical protein ANBU17_01720 [Anaerostipes butyraticus]|uniref:Uncharacterized protein n=1 Tax=Anaerostipes butyraticus TaxID=645466 RepID=A0A916Q717_9FIRM|nr:hypothetical protein ANBU17_01720 [Anaerostipes butyraticus]